MSMPRAAIYYWQSFESVAWLLRAVSATTPPEAHVAGRREEAAPAHELRIASGTHAER